MGSPDRGHWLLAAFLAGDLDPAAARRWDEHLLVCEHCWQAVREDRVGRQAARMLRQGAPPGLADRVAFAVEVAAAGRQTMQPGASRGTGTRRRPRLGRGGWPHWPRLAGTAMLAAGLAITLLVVLLPSGHQARNMPAAVAAVARYAQTLPLPSGSSRPSWAGRAAPVQVGHPVTLTAGGQQIVMRTWRLGGVEAVVALSTQPFSTPARAMGIPGREMAWAMTAGTLGLYCLNGRQPELVAARIPLADLATLTARLPPA